MSTLTSDVTYKQFLDIISTEFSDALSANTIVHTIFDYHGFDLLATFEAIKVIVENNKLTNNQLIKDIYNLCVIFYKRGAAISKYIGNGSTTEGSKEMDRLAKLYGIKDKATGPSLTLPRLSLIFPNISLKCLDQIKNNVRLVVSPEVLNLPGTIMLYANCFPAILTESKARENSGALFMAIHNIYQTKSSEILSTNSRVQKTLSQLYVESVRFSQITLKGSLLETSTRDDLMKLYENIKVDTLYKSIAEHLNKILSTGSLDGLEAHNSINYLMMHCSKKSKLMTGDMLEQINSKTYVEIAKQYK